MLLFIQAKDLYVLLRVFLNNKIKYFTDGLHKLSPLMELRGKGHVHLSICVRIYEKLQHVQISSSSLIFMHNFLSLPSLSVNTFSSKFFEQQHL